jgi:hypothetical protein
MREAQVTLPELALIAGTRVALGAGLGLLLADRLADGPRKAVGWTLLLVGALSTVPLAMEVLGKVRPATPEAEAGPAMRGGNLQEDDQFNRRGAVATG